MYFFLPLAKVHLFNVATVSWQIAWVALLERDYTTEFGLLNGNCLYIFFIYFGQNFSGHFLVYLLFFAVQHVAFFNSICQ